MSVALQCKLISVGDTIPGWAYAGGNAGNSIIRGASAWPQYPEHGPPLPCRHQAFNVGSSTFGVLINNDLLAGNNLFIQSK
jgi:hypothetical protein